MNYYISIIQICLLMFVAGLLTSCGYIGKKDRQIQELQQALDAAKVKADKTAREFKRQIESLQNELNQEHEKSSLLKSNLENELEKVRQNLERGNQERQKIQREWEEYRAKYRISSREKATGEKYDTLALNNGEAFANVTIKRVDAAYVHVVHELGVARLRIDDLGVEWMARFDYEPEKALALMEKEARQKIAAAGSITSANPDLASDIAHAKFLKENAKAGKIELLNNKRNELKALLQQYYKRISYDYQWPENDPILRSQVGLSHILTEARSVAQEINQLKKDLVPDAGYSNN